MGRSTKILLIFLGCVQLGVAGCGPPMKRGLVSQAGGNRPYQAMDFRGWDLRHTSFEKADVHDVDFRFAQLQGTNFSHGNLKDADLRGTTLKGANFTNTNVNQARLYEARFEGAIFDQVNWNGYNFKDARLAQTSFRSAQLNQTDFTGADLTEADFSNTDLRYTRFKYTQFIKAKFAGANLAGLDLRNRDFRGADFSGANLTNTDFSQANLEGAKLTGATLVGTNFEKANLLEIDFSGVYLDHIKLKGSKLKAPRFSRAQIKGVSFEGLDLKNSDFEGAWLRNVGFKTVDLSNSNFKFSKLEDTLLLESDLSSADISHADFSQALLYKTNFSGVLFDKTLFPTLFEPKTQTTFVQAPMGCYLMGNNFSPQVGFDASPHSVCVNDFFVATKEVTQAQFSILLGYNPSFHGKHKGQLPVENLNFHEVNRFLSKFQQVTGLTVRLPEEAEWEYVCRELGAKVRYGNGKNKANPIEIAYNGQKKSAQNKHADYQTQLVWQSPLDVGSFKPNKLGLFDLSGNVSEMVSDPWNSQAYRQKTGSSLSESRGVRGGNFSSSATHINCAKRSFMTANEMDRHVGFRLVKVINEKELLNQSRFQIK